MRRDADVTVVGAGLSGLPVARALQVETITYRGTVPRLEAIVG